VDFELAIRHGTAVASALRMLRDQGVIPDVIVGHSGWGETLFVKDVYPEVPLLAYFEFFYRHEGVDVDFDPEFPPSPDDSARLRVRNAVNLLSFQSADWGNAPTRWQQSLYPEEMRARISVIHEGIDTDAIRPDPDAWLQLDRDNLVLTRNDEIITYVARNLEPYRGFHVFMRALPEIQRRRPDAHVLIVGGDEVSYGSPLRSGLTYRQHMLAELEGKVNLDRVHFLGQLPYENYVSLLQISSAHVYLTYPFVLSWSFLEAMAAGCVVIGSRTPPVEEVIEDGVNGFLVDFFSTDELVDKIETILDDKALSEQIRDQGRQTVIKKYDLHTRMLKRWHRLLDGLAAAPESAS
jgi:glycosyltransferase involved in cell wall biosynthesis